MSPELFAVYVPRDAYVDRIDALLSEEFSASISSITQGNIYHYLDLERTGDVVRHIQSGQKRTVMALAALLHDHCGFVRPGEYYLDTENRMQKLIEPSSAPAWNESIHK